MGSCLCKTDDSQLTCPFGSVSIKHCGCLGKKSKEDEEEARINAVVAEQLIAIEKLMIDEMLNRIRQNGVMPDVLLSPHPEAQTLRVHFPSPTPPIPTETEQPADS